MSLRVDEIPLPLRPAFQGYGLAVGALGQALLHTIRTTCHFERRAADASPRIECIWHEHLLAYMASYLPSPEGRRYVWMNHPVWFMRPVHVILRWRGVEALALGSSGHGGRDALARVIAWLGEGASTLVAVDGPAGPPHRAKAGALEMSAATGVPIVPIRFDYERAVRLPGWDRKRLPLPGSRVIVTEQAPLRVASGEDVEAARAALAAALGV